MPDHDDFYVGYLAMPRSHRRFLQTALPLTLLAVLLSAAAIALTQRDPGAGTWQTGEASTWSGMILIDPYPTLHIKHGEDRSDYLLVRMGKFGAREIAEPFTNQGVVVRGRLLERDGRRMIELDDAPGADAPIRPWPVDAPIPTPPRPVALGIINTRGEILDAKCYLGAMKPGDGKAHKACAILCLEAGVPPMLVSRADDGSPRYHILLERNGDPISAKSIALAGEPVRVEGIAEARGNLTYLRVISLSRDGDADE